MPTYEYECLKCGYEFEKFQMMTDEPIKTCPKCKKSVRRLIGTGGGIIFKGPGFYATDYKKSSASTDADKANKDKKPKDSNCDNCCSQKQCKGK